jgi:hypothetical protein
MKFFLLPLTPALSRKGRGNFWAIFYKGLFGAEIAEYAEEIRQEPGIRNQESGT